MNIADVLRFLIILIGFIFLTALSICFNFDISSLNLLFAMCVIFTLYFNDFRKNTRIILFMTMLILGLTCFIISAKTWSVWLFVLFAIGVWWGLPEDNKNIDKLLIFTASFFNLSIISNTAYSDIQYDFASCFNYIEYILENNFLFWNENPLLTRPSYSTYHPILHFFLAGVVIWIVDFFSKNTIAAMEAVQVFFCAYMLWYYLIAARLLKLFNFDKRIYLSVLAFVVFFPIYNAISGFFNNDCLLLPLQAGTIYYALLYYKDGKKRNLFLTFVFAVCASLTKLSGVLVLPIVFVALLLRLLKNKDIKTLTEQVGFGICLLLGVSLWSLYQTFVLDVGASFVPPQEHLSLKPYSLWDRFNPLGAFIYENMFYNDFGINLWETMTKTALFGQWDFSYRGHEIMWAIMALVLIYKVILISVIGSFLYLLWKDYKNTAVLFGSVLIFSLLLGEIAFILLHPYMCNQDFRYVALLPLGMAMILGVSLNKLTTKYQCSGIAILGIFSLLSACVWWFSVSFGG